MKLKTIIGYAVIVMVAWWAVTNPVEAGTTVKHLSVLLATAANGFGKFLGAL